MKGKSKVSSLVYVFKSSNRLANPFMLSIILNSYFSSMLENKVHEDAVMQVRNILL